MRGERARSAGLKLFAIVFCAFSPFGAGACGREQAAAGGSPSASPGPRAVASAAPAASAPDCGHSVCTDNLFIDGAPAGKCLAGSVCSVSLTLVATGDFHVNDEYPYRFKADPAKGLTFLGTDEGGKNVFSKGAGDWKKVDPKSGAMTVKFTPEAPGPQAVAGVLKLSVCSGATCQLEQSRVSVMVSVD